MSFLRRNVLKSYRSLLRVQQHRFRGDSEMIKVFRLETRNSFKANKFVENEAQIKKLLNDAEEAREFISKELVQAKKSSSENYELLIDKEHTFTDEEMGPTFKSPEK